MPQILLTVQDMIDQVRTQLDEQNRDSVSDTADILPTLNRAQDYAFDILTRKYPEPLIKYTILTLGNGTAEYDIPENVFEERISHIEIRVPSSNDVNGGATYREVQRVSYRDISNYESASKTNLPYYYCIFSRKIRFVPTPTGTYNARVWYVRTPESLVSPQGRITIINSSSNYVIVDSAGSDLSTESDQFESYVNVVDGQTGEIKQTLQIQSLVGNKITFRSTPTRSTVLNRTVDSSLASTVEKDDYICSIQGTCVPYDASPIANFIIEYTVAEITRKLGGSAELEEKVLEKFEKQVERHWAGREVQLRIKKRSQNWGVPTRRWYFE